MKKYSTRAEALAAIPDNVDPGTRVLALIIEDLDGSFTAVGKSAAAQLDVIAKVLIEAGLITGDEFERRYSKALAAADQVYAQSVDDARKAD